MFSFITLTDAEGPILVNVDHAMRIAEHRGPVSNCQTRIWFADGSSIAVVESLDDVKQNIASHPAMVEIDGFHGIEMAINNAAGNR